MPIRKEQLGLRIADTYTPDYSERQEAVVTINFCNDCWERIKANNKGGLEKAIRKFEESQRIEDSMTESFNRRNKS
jgi:cytoskeletal protein RodZ